MTKGPKNLEMKIGAASLHRLLYNAKLYQVGKDAPGMKMFWGDDGGVSMSVFDRYTYLEDYATYEPGRFDYLIELPADSVKLLEVELRQMEDAPLTVEINTSDRKLLVDWEDIVSIEVPYEVPGNDTEGISTLVSPAEHMSSSDPVALYGDRFRKLALIQPQDYPVDVKVVEHNKFGPMVAFRKGPTVMGAIAALDRDVLHKDLASGRELW